MGSTQVRWLWDGSRWLREQNGSAHTTDNGAQVRSDNIVIAVVAKVDTGLVDSAGGVVPEFVWAGSGPVTVFTDGHRIDGTWTRPSLAEVAILADHAGEPILLSPGTTWVELVTEGQYSFG